MKTEEWHTFSLTYVEYPEDDLLGKVLAILSLTPLVVVIVHLTVFAVQRDLHTLFYGLGTILNGVLNYLLKHTLQEPRPNIPNGEERVPTKLWERYGMPSSHSQFMWFVSVYMVLFVTLRLHHQHKLLETVTKSAVCLGYVSMAATVSYGRIYLHYHTPAQVYWGAAIGGGMAVLWFALTQCIFTPVFSWLASTWVSESLMIRDYTDIPNVVWFDYLHARSEAKSRTRKRTVRNKAQ